MLQENAIDLPEIRTIIGSFLSHQDLIICAQVSHAWRQSFRPLIWRETILRSSHNCARSTYLPPPSVPMFRKHGGLIRSLALEGPTSQKEILRGLECTQLEQLRISATIPVMEPKLWSVILPNTSGNGTLRWSSTDSTRYSGSAGAGGRWNLLLSVEGDDDEGTNISGSHKEYSDKIDKSHVDNESNANDDGESSEDSFWSSWNRSDREDEYESDDSIESTKDDDSLICQIDMWKSLADLVRQNRATLKTLEVNLYSPPPYGTPNTSFWEAVVDCFPSPFSYSSSTLTSLSLVGREIEGTDLMLLWRAACPHLRRLELARCDVENRQLLNTESALNIAEATAMIMETELYPLSALQYLRLVEVRGMVPKTQFKMFIARSPRLKSLVWHLHKSHAGLAPNELWISLQDDDNYLRSCDGQESLQQWYELTSLEITSGKESLAISDQQISILLDQSSQSMERLALGAVQVGMATFQSLGRHFDSLGHLDLRLCTNVTGAMVQQVLASCLGLKSIAADKIHALDILDGDPWVCLHLKSWTIFIDLSASLTSSQASGSLSSRKRTQYRRRVQKSESISKSSKNDNHDNQHMKLQEHVYERLATLVNLENLDLDRHYPLTDRDAFKTIETLDWQLSKGLEKLITLSHVKTVCLSSHYPMKMSNSEALWMIEHWLQLEAVRGRLGERKVDHKEFARLFERNGIHVNYYYN